MRRIRAGDQRAAEDLVREYEPIVLREIRPDEQTGSRTLARHGSWHLPCSRFPIPKSEPSTKPSAVSPLHQAAFAVNLLAFQIPKSEPSTRI
jgi:hypothetical protein